MNNVYELFTESNEFNIDEEIDIKLVNRYVLHDKPRITKFNIDWDNIIDDIPSYKNFMFNENVDNNNLKNEFINLSSKAPIT